MPAVASVPVVSTFRTARIMTAAAHAGSMRSRLASAALVLTLWATCLLIGVPACAQTTIPLPPPSEAAVARLAQSVVKFQAFVPPEARSSSRLGTKREGSGVVIGGDGLIVTIGYLIMEAMAVEVTDHTGKGHRASVVGYDQTSGLGLLRLDDKTALPPLEIGDSAALAERQPVIVAAGGGREGIQPALVVSRREFAGPWEYLLDRAIYTAPAIGEFGGAALVGGDGKLLGIGSLIVEAVLPNQPLPGNVFVPIDLLTPILEQMVATGKPPGPGRPWLGMNTSEVQGGMLIVGNVNKDGPAGKAGIQRGDVVLGVGTGRIQGLADFYRKVWGLGGPGVEVPLDVMQKDGFRQITIKSDDRYRFLKLQPTY